MKASEGWILRRARIVVRCGGVIAYPTEAVIGLGCDPLNKQAVDRLLALKERSWRQGLIVIGANIAQLAPFMGDISQELAKRMTDAWPGPVTFLVPVAPGVPKWLTGGRPVIALRVPAHARARALCRACGPLVSTSANRHGSRPARDIISARMAFRNSLDLYVPGQTDGRSRPSVIIDGRDMQVRRD